MQGTLLSEIRQAWDKSCTILLTSFAGDKLFEMNKGRMIYLGSQLQWFQPIVVWFYGFGVCDQRKAWQKATTEETCSTQGSRDLGKGQFHRFISCY